MVAQPPITTCIIRANARIEAPGWSRRGEFYPIVRDKLTRSCVESMFFVKARQMIRTDDRREHKFNISGHFAMNMQFDRVLCLSPGRPHLR